MENAAVIENALLYTLEQGIHTGDFGDKNIPSLNTTQFAEAIISNFGKKPAIECQRTFTKQACYTNRFQTGKKSDDGFQRNGERKP